MDPSLGFAQLLGIASVNQKDKTTNDKMFRDFFQEREEKRKKVEAKLKTREAQ